MAAQFPDFHPYDIEQKIFSIKKQKSFIECVKHRLKMRLKKEPQNGKKKQYINKKIKYCDEKLNEFESNIATYESLLNYHSQFKCA